MDFGSTKRRDASRDRGNPGVWLMEGREEGKSHGKALQSNHGYGDEAPNAEKAEEEEEQEKQQ